MRWWAKAAATRHTRECAIRAKIRPFNFKHQERMTSPIVYKYILVVVSSVQENCTILYYWDTWSRNSHFPDAQRWQLILFGRVIWLLCVTRWASARKKMFPSASMCSLYRMCVVSVCVQYAGAYYWPSPSRRTRLVCVHSSLQPRRYLSFFSLFSI